ncbi:MAG: hypothetical protein ACYCTH_14380, partial [Cellulomonas sp.]
MAAKTPGRPGPSALPDAPGAFRHMRLPRLRIDVLLLPDGAGIECGERGECVMPVRVSTPWTPLAGGVSP